MWDDILVQDDGAGPYIAKWKESLGPKPTETDIAQWKIDLQPQYEFAQNKLSNKTIYDQLDDIDLKSIRALRTNNTVRLEELEQEAVILRNKLLPVE